MSKSFKQLEKYYYESIQSAENYGFNYQADKDFISFDDEIKMETKNSIKMWQIMHLMLLLHEKIISYRI